METPALAALVESVRAFVRDEVPAHQAELFATERLPEPLRAGMAGLRLFGMDLPERWGGLGLNTVEACQVIEALCHGPQALARWAGPGGGWAAGADADPARRALVETYAPRLLSGESRIAFTLTEPGAGSDAAAISTRAERRGDVYVLNGHKHLISFAGATDLYLVFAKTDPAAGAHGVTAFLVEADCPGLTVPRLQPKLGLDGMPVGEVLFQDCEVPATHCISEEGRGFVVAMQGLDAGRLKLIAAVAVGAAQAVLDYCVEHVRSGAAEGDADWARTVLADMATQITAGRYLVRACAERMDRGEVVTTESAMCKVFCAEMNDRVADLGLQLVGTPALDPAHPINRFYRDARLGRLWDGTSEIQRFIIGRALLRG